jgi:hypothetical protein
MKLAADLHIHSCLSPCAEDEMTPNNIVNMARLKGLDVISVLDHNSALNLPAVSYAAERAGLLLLPGIELQTREEIHLLCYLPTVDAALAFGETIYDTLQPIPAAPEIFGSQTVMDKNDDPAGTPPDKLLVQSSALSIEDAADICRKLKGVPVPAHIDRQSYSIVSNLGFIPPGLNFRTLEKNTPERSAGIDESGYMIITSSDAHRLCDIFERKFFIGVKTKSVSGVLDFLMRGKITGKIK